MYILCFLQRPTMPCRMCAAAACAAHMRDTALIFGNMCAAHPGCAAHDAGENEVEGTGGGRVGVGSGTGTGTGTGTGRDVT